ncbi:alpha/beta hydrolase family esterase [Sorangium sp. So ce861]|uniref:alpha/beta hydrolase family esterase n=1 Tax=Sorangium sp. So ce861 TaxID=3133323 RepID=UPI003F5E25B9
METLRNWGAIAPGLVALAAFAALACSSQGDGTTDAGGSAGGLAGPGASGSGAADGSSATSGSSATGGPSATSASSGEGGGVGGSGGRPSSAEAGAGGMGAGSGSSGSGGEAQSAGCGSATAPASGRFSIDVGGTTREYILAVPDGYDSSRAYRLVFAWHPRGGSAEQVATGFGGGYYGLQSRAAGSAIFVSPEGLDQGWANTGGRDIAFLRAMLDRLRAELCIDESRIFSTGFSYGGMMSYAIGCAMGDVFRAIAPMSGALYSGCDDGDHPVAMWGAHGDADNVVPLDNGRTALDVFLERNGCDQQTTPVDPSPCVSYEGCDAGYPVVWCEFSGGHTMPSNSGESIWNFFSQF